MSRKVFKPEQIIGKLREAEGLISRGQTVGEVCRQIGVTDQTYYRWRKEYGGLRLDQAKRLKELEKENRRLKRVVADPALDRAILKEAAQGNWRARRSAGRPWGMRRRRWAFRSVGPAGCSARDVPRSVSHSTCRKTSSAWWRTSWRRPRGTAAMDSGGSRRGCVTKTGR